MKDLKEKKKLTAAAAGLIYNKKTKKNCEKSK